MEWDYTWIMILIPTFSVQNQYTAFVSKNYIPINISGSL